MKETISVDITNPGQVFACLGVLEITDMLSPGALGNFTEDDSFQVDAKIHLHEVVDSLKKAVMEEEAHTGSIASWGGDKTWPILVRGNFGAITLDPWLTPSHRKTETGCKLWAGRVDTLNLLRDLQETLEVPGPGKINDLFSRGHASTPSGLDPRSAISKEDLGYSYNSHNFKPIVYPAVDLFAMVGLQGARPEQTGGLTYAYYLWDRPLPPLVARAVLTGRIPSLSSSRWEYTTESRGLGGTYRYLSQSRPADKPT